MTLTRLREAISNLMDATRAECRDGPHAPVEEAQEAVEAAMEELFGVTDGLRDLLNRPDVKHALEIGRMGRPYQDVQGALYMNERYKSHPGADATFTDYGLAHAACVLFNVADDILSALASPPMPGRGEGWQDISEAKKDGTIIWAIFRDDIYPTLRPEREDLTRWNGVQVPLRHTGITADGYDFGWGIAAPVGHGGFPDEWIAGWLPLPASRPEEDTQQ